VKAVELLSQGEPAELALTDNRAEPIPAAGEVLLRVRAAALNRVDQVIMKGYPGLRLEMPHVLGADFAGEIAELGAAVTGWSVGDIVGVYPLVACGECPLCTDDKPNLCMHFQYFGMHRAGGLAEFVCVPAANLARLPAGLDHGTAATAGVAGVTALHALRQNHNLRAGNSLMIWGATGGVGVFLIQLAKAVGLQVIATTRRKEAAALLSELGADHVLVGDIAAVADKVRELYPAGVDQVVDYVGPATFTQSHELLKKGGTLTLCGMLTGVETNLSIHQTYFRHLQIQGINLGTRDEYDELLGMLGTGALKIPIVKRLPLARAKDALLAFANDGHFGKVVVDI
jgi:NADPH2:quinone reductase